VKAPLALKLKLILVVVVAFVLSVFAIDASAQDDWEAVPNNSSQDSRGTNDTTAPAPDSSSPPTAPMRHRRAVANPSPMAPASSSGVTIACGEKVVPASPKIQSIVSQINGAWGSNVNVYRSVAMSGPHAKNGGCVFYNPEGLAMLLGLRLNLNDPNVVTPILYAIFAHEVGHEVHRDFDPSRNAVPDDIKELEADRFAGYTMEKLNVPATGLTPYWSMTGDEFGAGVKHGSSEQRVGAFKEGWHEAEWNRAENSKSVSAATQESIAPEDSTAAP
jgi:hypothetical protein